MARAPRGRSMYLPRVVQTAEDFSPFYQHSLKWLHQRAREYGLLHGLELSAGVGAPLNAARWLYAGAEWAAEKAAATGDPNMWLLTSKLSSTARQHELAAWELAARESAARKQLEQRAPAAQLATAITQGEPAEHASVTLETPPEEKP